MLSSKTIISILFFSLLLTGCLFETKQSSKMSQLKPSMEKIKRTAKLSLPIDVQMEITSDIDIGKEFELTATVSRKDANEEYRYELSLPDGLILIQGSGSEALNFDSENQAQAHFRIRHDAFENERIGLLVSSSSGNKQRFSISSLNYFKDKAEQDALLERQKEYLEENPEALEAQERASDRHDH